MIDLESERKKKSRVMCLFNLKKSHAFWVSSVPLHNRVPLPLTQGELSIIQIRIID